MSCQNVTSTAEILENHPQPAGQHLQLLQGGSLQETAGVQDYLGGLHLTPVFLDSGAERNAPHDPMDAKTKPDCRAKKSRQSMPEPQLSLTYMLEEGQPSKRGVSWIPSVTGRGFTHDKTLGMVLPNDRYAHVQCTKYCMHMIVYSVYAPRRWRMLLSSAGLFFFCTHEPG